MTLAEMERRATIFNRDSSPAEKINRLREIEELAHIEMGDWKPRMGDIITRGEPTAFDGPFWNDYRQPHISGDRAQVTLATTDKAMYLPGDFPVLGNAYFNNMLGKKLWIGMFGKITTAATPGNLTVDVYFGSGADANGTILASSAAQTLIAAQTNLSWEMQFWVHTRTLGVSGALFCRGDAFFNTAVVAVGDFLVPASAAAAVTVDVTGSNIISVQWKRSGSTVEVATTQDIHVVAYN